MRHPLGSPQPGTPFVQFRDVAFGHAGHAPVVQGIDLARASGEVHCLVGRSGCGKTTLLKLAAGLLAPTAGYRSIVVSAVDALDDVLPRLAPHAAFLQTAGLATTPDELYRLADALGQVGITRVTAIGSMTLPEAGWHHDGRFSLADLVRVVEIEQGAEAAADRLAPSWQEGRP